MVLSSLDTNSLLSLVVNVIVCVGENWPVVNFLIRCSSLITILWGHTAVPPHVTCPGIAVGELCSGLNDVRKRYK